MTHVKDKNRSKIKTCPPRFALIIRIGTEKVWNLASENISIENIRPVERVTSMLVTDVGDKIWDETKSCWWRFLPFWSPSVGAGRTATYLVKTISKDADLHKRPLKNFYFFFSFESSLRRVQASKFYVKNHNWAYTSDSNTFWLTITFDI